MLYDPKNEAKTPEWAERRVSVEMKQKMGYLWIKRVQRERERVKNYNFKLGLKGTQVQKEMKALRKGPDALM